ncbi:MAG: ABC transporter substrate-binding protein [Caldilineaceae bacterium]
MAIARFYRHWPRPGLSPTIRPSTPLRCAQGVAFHDGTPFDAADVVATFDRIINPGDNLSISGIRESLAMVDSVTAADDSTVTFTLKEPTIPISWRFWPVMTA